MAAIRRSLRVGTQCAVHFEGQTGWRIRRRAPGGGGTPELTIRRFDGDRGRARRRSDVVAGHAVLVDRDRNGTRWGCCGDQYVDLPDSHECWIPDIHSRAPRNEETGVTLPALTMHTAISSGNFPLYPLAASWSWIEAAEAVRKLRSHHVYPQARPGFGGADHGPARTSCSTWLDPVIPAESVATTLRV